MLTQKATKQERIYRILALYPLCSKNEILGTVRTIRQTRSLNFQQFPSSYVIFWCTRSDQHTVIVFHISTVFNKEQGSTMKEEESQIKDPDDDNMNLDARMAWLRERVRYLQIVASLY